MNRNHHRIVFNAARGQLMAVSETAAACTGSTATSEGPARALRPSRWHRAGAALLTAFATLNSQAQISADPNAPGNLRATVLTAPNGVPLVNIQTPSAAGVSRNVYRQFDVGTPGAILNNSRTNVQTQLGGWVQGNPWLATGPARVILNEVNSSQPSQLNGWVEVGGQRAEVVIANPAGIHVNGGGFINASRATLTTGTPLMNAGALEGFRVQGGQVRVDGLGLDASTTDHAAILARAIEVNAGLRAQALTVVAGVNDVSADISAITPLAATSAVGPTPTFALDVAALGGMYAGQIHLVGTEAGLGVNQAGLIDAQGTLTLDVNGWLSQSTGSRTYGDAVTINAQGVRNQNGAVVAARESLTIAAGEIHNTEGSLLLSAGNMALTASERIENRSASIEALSDLTISTPVLVNANDHFESTVVQGESTRFLRLVHNGVEYTSEEIGANFGPLNSYLDNPGFSILLPSSEFPFSEFPADITSWATRARFSVGGGGNSYGPIVGSAFAIAYSRSTKKDCRDCNWEVIDNYPADHGIWAKFGVASFGLMPAYTGQDCQDGAGGYCSPAQWTAYNTYQSALASYATRKELAQDQLDQKIASYNLSVGSRTLRDWTVIDGTATEYTPVVLASSPAQILAGGNLNVHARDSFVNDKSEVIAGGVLTTTGAKLRNIDADVLARTEVRGQSVYSYYSEDCDLCNDDRYYLYTDYAADTTRLVRLPVSRVQDRVAAPGFGAEVTSLPNSALFQINTQSNARFLVETDPRFTDKHQWLSSDYLLAALAIEPTHIQKRLGDGFYEQRLIREQVSALTGHRFLGDFTTDDEQYRQLMDAGVTFAQAHHLRPGIALSAAQVALLTSDIVWLETQTVTLPDGSTTQALVPRVYLLPRAGDLAPTGALIAGREVQIQLDGMLYNGGTIAGRSLVHVDAKDIPHSGRIESQGTTALSAERDIVIAGGHVSARDALVLSAGQDITVASTTRSSQHTGAPLAAEGGGSLAGLLRKQREPQPGSQTERTTLDRVASLHVTGEAGALLVQSGRDVTLQAAVIDNAGTGTTALLAARDLKLSTVTTSSRDEIRWNASNHLSRSTSAEVGTTIQAGGAVSLVAGGGINARAAQVQAGGALAVQASESIQIEAGEQSHAYDEAHRTRSGGVFSRTTTTTRNAASSNTGVASALGGQTVDIRGGQDVNIRGSQVIGDEGLVITAERDVSITAVQTRSSQRNFQDVKTSGFSMEGASVSLGSQQQSTNQHSQGTGAAASTVGAIGGNLNIVAGRTYTQTGSDVLAPGGDITVAAQSVRITEARETNRTDTEQKFNQSGLTLALSSPVLSAMQNIGSQLEAAGDTKSTRMQGLAAANSAFAAQSALDAIQAGQGTTIDGKANQVVSTNLDGSKTARDANAADQAGGINLSISIGASKSQSNSRQTSDSARGSTVAASGAVSITASGAGKDSDILIRGSEVSAGTNATLSAEGDVALLAAKNTASLSGSNKSSSGSIGLSFGTSGFGVTVSASAGRGKEAGDDLTHTHTHINAGNTVVVRSGGDTTLQGALVKADKIQAEVAGNLLIESLQDTSTYASQQKSVAASATIGAGAGGSFSTSNSRVNSDYTSVAEQSGFKAGDGGFVVDVRGHTELIGGAIASSQSEVENDLNSFTTGTLSSRDLQNSAHASAKSSGVNLSSDMASQGKYGVAKAVIGNALNNAGESGMPPLLHSVHESIPSKKGPPHTDRHRCACWLRHSTRRHAGRCTQGGVFAVLP
jgi:filamentous hemagglutinin